MLRDRSASVGTAVLDDAAFRDLIGRVRAGDEEAAAAVVRLYAPEIRRIARVRLNDAGLRRFLDSTDICQSVLARFFVGAASGEFSLSSPRELLRLLATMAANRVRDKARRHRTRRRDMRRVRLAGGGAVERVADPRADPAGSASLRDLLRAVLGRLSGEERFLADQRAQGRDWAEIAAALGRGTPEALRKRLSRAVDRALHELGLDEVSHDP